MKTIFIYDEFNAEILFFVKDGDYSHLDKIYLNCYDKDVSIDSYNELSDMLYDMEGNMLVDLLDEFPRVEGEFVVVRVGFIP